jgi:hypothetical protein
MSKRTSLNYFPTGSGTGSRTPNANECPSQPKKPRVEFSQSIMIADLLPFVIDKIATFIFHDVFYDFHRPSMVQYILLYNLP